MFFYKTIIAASILAAAFATSPSFAGTNYVDELALQASMEKSFEPELHLRPLVVSSTAKMAVPHAKVDLARHRQIVCAEVSRVFREEDNNSLQRMNAQAWQSADPIKFFTDYLELPAKCVVPVGRMDSKQNIIWDIVTLAPYGDIVWSRKGVVTSWEYLSEVNLRYNAMVWPLSRLLILGVE